MTAVGPDRAPFDKFLFWLSPDRNTATEKYEEIRGKIVRFFVHKGCGDSNALFDKTIDRVVMIVDRGDQYSEPIGLCFGVAHKVWQEYIKIPHPGPLDGQDLPSPEPDDDKRLHEQKLKCLEDCLDQLPEKDRDLIRKYHEGQGRDKINARKQLAGQHGGNNTLRIKAFRIRGKLHICVTDCLKRAAN